MTDPIVAARGRSGNRRGAIVPLFAVLLPMLLIFAGFAINLAYMQLVSTELKITTDCAAHAGGRAMSVAQGDRTLTNEQKRDLALQMSIAKAQEIAQANPVVGRVLSVGTGSDSDIQIAFGRSVRANNGRGMYVFTETPMADILSDDQRPTSLAVTTNLELPMMFNVMKNSSFSYKDIDGTQHTAEAKHIDTFSPTRRSIATQVDRDIALVLDRSGSMLYFRDDEEMLDILKDLYETYDEIVIPGGWEYHYWQWRNSRYGGYWRDKGYHRPEEASGSWTIRNSSDRRWDPERTESERRISWSEYQDATRYLYDRRYSDNVIYQLERWENSSHTLGDSFSSSEADELTVDMAMFCYDWKYRRGAARYSRWWYLTQGVDAFLDVLDSTDQTELVSLVTFASSAQLDYTLQEDYSDIRAFIDELEPYGGTAIGDGMTTGLPPIVNGNAARPFAAKTIVVLTDGISNSGQDPDEAVADIMESNEVTIHTVTFTPGADKDAMSSVAQAGHGRHYHADDGSALIAIFEEIANNLPTILTE